MFYDIQKELNYKNILILIDDLSRINLTDYAFGLNSVIISSDKEENIKNIENLHKTNWYNVIRKHYNSNVYLSEYDFCDYVVNDNTFVSTFYMLDIEKANKINIFLINNKNRQIDVLCNYEIFDNLKKIIPTANIIPVDLSSELEREVRMYE